jgi:hypothetical protein
VAVRSRGAGDQHCNRLALAGSSVSGGRFAFVSEASRNGGGALLAAGPCYKGMPLEARCVIAVGVSQKFLA